MKEDICEILKGCVNSKSNEEREAYEAKIRTFKDTNPQEFLNSMTQQLNNQDLDEGARHLTGILFKNTIKAGDDTPLWFTLSEEVRTEFKSRILAPLADNLRSVRLSG